MYNCSVHTVCMHPSGFVKGFYPCAKIGFPESTSMYPVLPNVLADHWLTRLSVYFFSVSCVFIRSLNFWLWRTSRLTQGFCANIFACPENWCSICFNFWCEKKLGDTKKNRGFTNAFRNEGFLKAIFNFFSKFLTIIF